jgi:PST family polysaccharide transporter
VLLLGRDWAPAAPLLAWLSVVGALQLVTSSLGSLLISQRRARELTVLNGFSLVFACTAYFIGLRFGALGVASAYAISEIVRSPVAVWWATRTGPVRINDVGEAVFPFFMSAISVFAIVSLIQRQLSNEPALLLGLSIPISYAMTVATLVLTTAGRRCLNEAVKMAAEIRASLKWPKGSSWLRRQTASHR